MILTHEASCKQEPRSSPLWVKVVQYPLLVPSDMSLTGERYDLIDEKSSSVVSRNPLEDSAPEEIAVTPMNALAKTAAGRQLLPKNSDVFTGTSEERKPLTPL